MRDGCPFCDYDGPSEVLWTYPMPTGEVFVIAPIDPVTPGHLLVIPRAHVLDFAHRPSVTADVMRAAATLVDDPRVPYSAFEANLITSMGPAATQTVQHLHVHVVPRREGDGLPLPWTPNKALSEMLLRVVTWPLPGDRTVGDYCLPTNWRPEINRLLGDEVLGVGEIPADG